MVVPVWWISNYTLKQRRANQRARETQNQRESGAFLCCKVNARRLSMGRLRTAVGNEKPCSLKCARKSLCACARLTVLTSALSVQELLLFPGTFFPKLSSSQDAKNGKGYTKISDLWHQRSSPINLCTTAAASSREMEDLGIKHGGEGQSDWH